jgi:hypothetical protein
LLGAASVAGPTPACSKQREGGREGIREREMSLPVEGGRNQIEEEQREEGGMDFPKDLFANLENCRDFSVKHKFHINLKP